MKLVDFIKVRQIHGKIPKNCSVEEQAVGPVTARPSQKESVSRWRTHMVRSGHFLFISLAALLIPDLSVSLLLSFLAFFKEEKSASVEDGAGRKWKAFPLFSTK
jgi:hypothetical protein